MIHFPAAHDNQSWPDQAKPRSPELSLSVPRAWQGLFPTAVHGGNWWESG